MIANWIDATMSPPPLSGSSSISRASQVDQHTGIAAFSAPQPIIMTATAQNRWAISTMARVTPARARGR
ncbi:hypothetical protein D3C84_1265130 [compost metagenome]